jgi:hypothetical protein
LKKINLFPFERNRYYYGKHLTVNDFILEQEYMNNKRRFVNRYLHGTGVICGLDVIAIDEKTISIEAGACIDFAGREIVVDTPVIKKLSSIDGFDIDNDNTSLYLCINYDEKESENVYSVTGVNSANQSLEHNKYLENYSLTLTSQEPNIEINTTKPFYVSDSVIYSSKLFTIKQHIPLYANTNETLKFEIIVEKNSNSTEEIAFNYNLKLTCLTNNDNDTLTISFDESKHKKSMRYVIPVELKVSNIKDDYALIESVGLDRIKSDSSIENCGISTLKTKIKVTENSIENEVMKDYYSKSMEKISKYTSYQPSIYLAKIDLIKSGGTYLIENVKSMPFNQYVFSGQISTIMNHLILNKLEDFQRTINSVGVSPSKSQNDSFFNKNQYAISNGEVIIQLNSYGKFGQTFFSEPIAHNLGLGAVNISLGCASEVSDNSPIVYGSPEIFETSIKCETAVKLDVTTGTFLIGIRLLDNITTDQIKIAWTATKVKEADNESHERRVFIQPAVADLAVMQTCYFTASFENINDNRVVWSVKEPNGGTINANGMYTAPNTPGIYEIVAQSVAYPSIKDSVYAIVGELK